MSELRNHIATERVIFSSPWVQLIERTASVNGVALKDAYYAIRQHDYVSILAMTPNGEFPLVRQFRPAVARDTWELPAGTVDPGEDAATCCERELIEETGLKAQRFIFLGQALADTGRLTNCIYSYFVLTGERPIASALRSELDTVYVTLPELLRRVRTGEFRIQMQLGAILLALLNPEARHVISAVYRDVPSVL